MHTAPALPTVSPALQAGRFPRRKVAGLGAGSRARAAALTGLVGTIFWGSAGCGLPAEVDGQAAGALSPAAPVRTPQSCAAPGKQVPTPLNIVGGDMVMVEPPCSSGVGSALPLGTNGRHILFANFEGVDMQPGGTPGNSFENVGLRAMDLASKGVIALPPYDPDNPKRLNNILAIQKQVAKWYADMNVDVVISRPLSGDYLMSVVGGRQSDIVQKDGVVGISPLDCSNRTEANLNYAFSGSLSENPEQVAVTIAHEAGHAYGLVHTDNSKDIMFPSVSTVDGFLDGDVVDTPACAGGFHQDSKQVLIENLGRRQSPPPGGDAPTVALLAPQDGASLGKDVTIVVKADAHLGLDHVTLSVSRIEGGKARGAHPVAELRPPQSSAQILISSAGSYTVMATAYDRAGNLAVTQAQFTVATPTCSVPNDCAPGQRCDSNTCITPPLPTMPPAGMMQADLLRPYGTACEETRECQGGVCALTPVGQICTHYCTPDYLCAGGLSCVDGICLPPIYPQSKPKVGQLGGKCTRNQDCLSGACSPATDDSAPRYCTKECDPALAWSCPANMDCQLSDGAGGMKNRCLAKPSGLSAPAQGCSLADSREAGAAGGGVSLLLLCGLWLLGRRRRVDPAL